MSQTVTPSFAAQNASGSKALDFAFIIAGWPTVYTVARGDYALAGDFANFTSIDDVMRLTTCGPEMVTP